MPTPPRSLDSPADACVVVTGAAGGVGRRVLHRLAADASVARIVAIDLNPLVAPPDGVEAHRADLGTVDLADLLDGADVVLHLAFAADTETDPGAEHSNVEGTRRLLIAAAEAGVAHVVLGSSAFVYGAWANNPVPITEDAPLRPNAELAYAVQRAQAEHLVAEWVDAVPGRTAAVLRPCLALGPDGTGWIARSLAAAAGMRLGEEDQPAQFLHLDDLVDAVELARVARLDGAFNVAPDGWVPGESVRALAVGRPRLRLPAAMAIRIARLRWRFQRGPIPPGLLPFTMHPVLIANDKLRAAGWVPTHTNEQAYVAGTETPWWSLLSPSRKQELALGGASVGVLGVVVAIGVTVRRVSRRASAARTG